MTAADFLKNEKPNEFQARFRVEGEILVTIQAESLEEAEAKAKAKLDHDDFGTELDEVTDIGISQVWKSQAMFLVERDGRALQVSHLKEGDKPRQRTETGF